MIVVKREERRESFSAICGAYRHRHETADRETSDSNRRLCRQVRSSLCALLSSLLLPVTSRDIRLSDGSDVRLSQRLTSNGRTASHKKREE